MSVCGGVCSLCNSNNRPLGMQGKRTLRKQQSLLFHCRYGRPMQKKWKDVFAGARALWAITRVGKKAHREVKAWGTFSWQSNLVLISFSLASEVHVQWPQQNAQLLRSPLSPFQCEWDTAGSFLPLPAISTHSLNEHIPLEGAETVGIYRDPGWYLIFPLEKSERKNDSLGLWKYKNTNQKLKLENPLKSW